MYKYRNTCVLDEIRLAYFHFFCGTGYHSAKKLPVAHTASTVRVRVGPVGGLPILTNPPPWACIHAVYKLLKSYTEPSLFTVAFVERLKCHEIPEAC
jgi:hypothetical protein